MKKLSLLKKILLLFFLTGFLTGRSQVSLVYEDTMVVTSYADFVLPVTMKTGHDISAISLGFIFPEEYLEITGMEMAGGVQGYSYNVTDSLFQMAWSAVNPIAIADNGLVISLDMKTKDLSELEGTIRLELGATSEFADDSANIIENVVLQIPEISLPEPDTMSDFVKVYPNPFRDVALVEFYLEIESQVKIDVCNASGAYIMNIAEGSFPKGLHQVSLSAVYLRKGVYILKFKADDGIRTDSRLIKIVAYR